MNQDEKHLRLLSIFHYVVAAIIGLIGCLPFFYYTIHFTIVDWILGGPDPKLGYDESPILWGVTFMAVQVSIFAMMYTLSSVLFLAGRRLSQRRSHTFCIVVAALACTMFPFGTVLGIFTLIVLLRPSVKQLFGVALPP